MARIAFLTCAGCLPDALQRRDDAYEHDREVAAFTPAFRVAGLDLDVVDWRSDFDPASFNLVWIRSTWDYAAHCAEFLDRIDAAAAVTRVANPPAAIRWNLNKHYLLNMDPATQPIIPSLFIGTRPEPASDLFEKLQTDMIVTKPVVGSTGLGQQLLIRDHHDDVLVPPGSFAQPMIPSIRSFGELSLIFVGREFSHAVRKTAGADDYRIQVIYGGGEEAYAPDADTICAAARYLDALPCPTLAARVDLVQGPDGWMLMELECIEPHLFPTFGPRSARKFAAAIAAMLG